MSDLGDGVVTYGFGFAENDAHVLGAMRSRMRLPKRIAIGVYTGQPAAAQQAFCHRAIAAIKEQFGTCVGIVFFDHASPGCWINP
jgi:hypothetical protein